MRTRKREMARELDIDYSQYQFQFTRNWFRTRNLATFREKVLPEWKDKPCIYLELGVFEAMSSVWMLQKVLTHPDSYMVGIDPWLMTTKLDGEFMEDAHKRAVHNVSSWTSSKCSLIRGNSAEVLRRMCGKGYAGITKNSVDLCMIDGDHNELAVLDDAIHCLALTRPGGWLMFDDVENDIKKEHHVKQGLERFKEQWGSQIEFSWKDRYVECYLKRQ